MYYCGWDGGGTKTEVCAVDEGGREIARCSFGALNRNGISAVRVRQTVVDCVSYMAKLPGGLNGCKNLVIGMAGISNEKAGEALENAVRSAGYHGRLSLAGDQEIALAGAVRLPGAVLIAGTGAILYGKDEQGAPFRVGGYGYLIDDGGSGYAIGRDILSAVARAWDGRAKETCLQNLVFHHLGVQDITGVITWLYAPETGKEEVAALSPLLLPALERKDAAALQIAEKAALDLSELAVTGFQKAGIQKGELAMTGSIVSHYPLIRARTESLLRAACPGIALLSPRGCAAQGAAKMAMEECLS